jgi:hypothetical protein
MANRRVIVHVNERGSGFLYHWLFFMVAGLRRFPHGRLPAGDAVTGGSAQERNVDLYKGQRPDFIWIPSIESGMLDFQRQTLEIISEQYPVITTDQITRDDIVVSNYGEMLDLRNYPQNNGLSCDAYRFLRTLMGGPEIDGIPTDGRTVFIRRGRAHELAGNNGLRRRQITNEDEIVAVLEGMGIECIYLEDLSVADKVALFSRLKRVISPNSAGLSFCTFMQAGSQVLELNVPNPSQVLGQYQEICDCLGIGHRRLITRKLDNDDNMHVDPRDLIDFITRA